nr:MAG TPA: tail protein [Caudoviricetes sp.]
MELKIYDKANNLRLTASPNTSSSVTEEIGGECSVSASFTHTAYVPLDVDDYIDLEGVRFKIKSRYRPKQKNTQTYEYSVKFYAPIHDAEDTLMLFQEGGTTSEFSYDGGPREHLQLWIDNMNRRAGGNLWSIGTVITADNKTIDYRNVKCWDAAFGSNGIAATFETEMWADGYVINLCKAERGETVELGYLHGLTNLAQEDNGEVKFFTRLFPLGSTRNIDATKYGYSRLQLPDRSLYVDKNVDLYGVKEETEEAAFAEIYPQYVGTVSSVRTEEKTSEEGRKYTVYYFKDSGMDWNPKDYEIPDLDYMLQFQTGELAGRGTDGSFQAAWHEDTREWEIINVYPDETTQIPGGVIIPNPGDKYIPWNFAMPQEYITAAEQAYKQAVDDFLNTYSFDPNKYTGTTDRNYIENNNTPLRIGWNVRLLSEQYFGSTGGYKDTRITKVQRKLNDLCQATITCSDEVGSGWKSSVDNSLNSLRYEVARQAEQYVYDVIRSFDEKTPSDKNIFSALKSLKTHLRKDAPDRTEFLMKLLGGIISPFLTSPDFVTGMMGAGMSFSSEEGGESVGWIDKLYVRKKAILQLLSIMETELAGASMMFNSSGARATITKVEFIEKKGIRFKDGKGVKFSDGKRGYSSPGTYGSVYRCYFLADDGEKAIENRFKPGNLVRSQSFNIKEGAYDGVSNHYWWRLVENVGDNWIEVSVSHCDEGSDIPAVGDVMVQLGDVSDTDFQAAIVLSAYGDGAPSLTFYQGISSYSLSGKDIVSIGYDRLTKEGYFNVYGKTYIGNRDKTNYIRLASGEIEVRAARILLSNGESVVDVAEKNISIKLGATGIDIEKNEIVISSDKFKIKSSEGKGIAVFTVKNGKPLLLTECIDVNSLKVKHLDGADGTFSGELKAAKGTFSGTISADGAKIGGFTIDNGSLNWKGMDFFGNDSRSIRIGVPTDDNSGMIDINFNGATDGKFGVKVIGSNDGGACIYASRNGTSKPHSSNTYAGYFDGGVHVNGNLYTNMILSNEFGTGWSLQADGSYTYKKGATRTISWTIRNGSIPSTYKLVFENGILVD